MTNLPVPGLALNASASAFTPTNTSQESVVNSTTAAKAKSKKGIKRKQRKDIVKSKQATSTSTSHQVVQVSKARQPPSVASGGIPSPSISYLAQSLLPSSSLPQPRRILVVVDLNGTLLHRPSRRRPSSFVERPHARPFLKYCLETFHLAIWSSARAQNVNNMVNQLLTPEERKKCLVIWARDRLGLSQSDYDARVQVYKRLSLLWKDPVVRASNPDSAARQGGAGTWDQSNTVLVDDSPEKGRSEPYNILPIPEFSGLDGEVPNVLPQVHDYLNQLCFQADISRFMRETPFVLDPNYALPVDS